MWRRVFSELLFLAGILQVAHRFKSRWILSGGQKAGSSKPELRLVSSTKDKEAGRTEDREGGRTWKGSRGHKRRAAAADVQEEEYENAGEWNGVEATSNKERRIVGKEQKSTTWPMGQRREWTQK